MKKMIIIAAFFVTACKASYCEPTSKLMKECAESCALSGARMEEFDPSTAKCFCKKN